MQHSLDRLHGVNPHPLRRGVTRLARISPTCGTRIGHMIPPSRSSPSTDPLDDVGRNLLSKGSGLPDETKEFGCRSTHVGADRFGITDDIGGRR